MSHVSHLMSHVSCHAVSCVSCVSCLEIPRHDVSSHHTLVRASIRMADLHTAALSPYAYRLGASRAETKVPPSQTTQVVRGNRCTCHMRKIRCTSTVRSLPRRVMVRCSLLLPPCHPGSCVRSFCVQCVDAVATWLRVCMENERFG